MRGILFFNFCQWWTVKLVDFRPDIDCNCISLAMPLELFDDRMVIFTKRDPDFDLTLKNKHIGKFLITFLLIYKLLSIYKPIHAFKRDFHLLYQVQRHFCLLRQNQKKKKPNLLYSIDTDQLLIAGQLHSILHTSCHLKLQRFH